MVKKRLHKRNDTCACFNEVSYAGAALRWLRLGGGVLTVFNAAR